MVERMSDALAFLTEQVAARAHLCVAKKAECIAAEISISTS